MKLHLALHIYQYVNVIMSFLSRTKFTQKITPPLEALDWKLVYKQKT